MSRGWVGSRRALVQAVKTILCPWTVPSGADLGHGRGNRGWEDTDRSRSGLQRCQRVVSQLVNPLLALS